MSIKYTHIIIALLLVVILIQHKCGGDYDCSGYTTDTVTTVDTLYNDTGTHTVTTKPKPVYIDTGQTDTLYRDIDTAAILADYYTKRYYQDTIVDDTSIMLISKDTVTRNRLTASSHAYKLKEPSIIKKTIVRRYKQKTKLYAGALIGSNMELQPSMGASLLLQTKNENLYGVTVDPFNKSIYAHINWQLWR